jgi:hypothetical protein
MKTLVFCLLIAIASGAYAAHIAVSSLHSAIDTLVSVHVEHFDRHT